MYWCFYFCCYYCYFSVGSGEVDMLFMKQRKWVCYIAIHICTALLYHINVLCISKSFISSLYSYIHKLLYSCEAIHIKTWDTIIWSPIQQKFDLARKCFIGQMSIILQIALLYLLWNSKCVYTFIIISYAIIINNILEAYLIISNQ